MKSLITVLFMISASLSTAQNLVPNSSFEDSVACPDQIGQVDLAVGWVNWGVTPDYFNACANSSAPLYGVPVNWRGFQQAHFGQAYMGLFTFADLIQNYREYIGRALSSPLVIGQTYFVSLWVCRAEQLLCSHASDKIGVRFTTVANYSIVNPDTALNNAHIFSNVVITDTSDWTLVSGSFIADSAYTHIGIGNYFDDLNTTITNGDPTSNYAYYLVDDICVSIDPQFCNPETSVHQILQNNFEIFPNPTSDVLNLQMTDGIRNIESVTISDLTGKQLLVQPINSRLNTHQQIDVSNLAPGVYIVKIKNSNHVFQSKLVKL